MNIPARTYRAGIREKLWGSILDSRRKIKWMLWTILAPEVLVGKAVDDKLALEYGYKLMRTHGWEKIHVHLANMGYFVLHFDETLDITSSLSQSLPSDSQITVFGKQNSSVEGDCDTVVDGTLWNFENFYANVEGLDSNLFTDRFKLQRLDSFLGRISDNLKNVDTITHSTGKLERLNSRYWTLTALQWDLVCQKNIAELPETVPQTLENLDRGGTIVKLLALLQVGHLIVQLIARQVAHLPSSQLEITALAYSISSFAVYLLFWGKPQGVEIYQTVEATRMPTRDEVVAIAKRAPDTWWKSLHTPDEMLKYTPLPNDAIQYPSKNKQERSWGIVLCGVLFGCVHLVAWNFQFHTSWERIAWRTCSVVTSVLPITLVVTENSPYVIVSCLFYTVARLFLLIEAFRTLFYLPPDAFIETWSISFQFFD